MSVYEDDADGMGEAEEPFGVCDECGAEDELDDVVCEPCWDVVTVEGVVLTDREPREESIGGVFWEPGFDYSRPHQVSFAIADAGKWKASMINGLMVYRFPTREDADKAMSAALIAWAKSQPDAAADTTLEMMSSHP